MQHPTLQIRDRLLAGLDREYNVVDMALVIDVLSQLETISITKEALEVSRLGKHINELRRKASDRHLANRAKSLVKKWRQLLVVSASPAISAGSTENHVLNGTGNGQTPSKPSSRLTSPMSETPIKCNVGLSPGPRHGGLSSLPSSASTSPGLPASRPSTPMTCQPVSPYLRNGPPVLASSKRTFQQRCDDDTGSTKNGPVLPDAKRPRLNGKTSDYLIEDSISSDNNANNLLMSLAEDSMSKASSRCLTPTTPVVNDVADLPDDRSARRKVKASRIKEEAKDGLTQRMASIRKMAGNKVRTTQQLVQEMALASPSVAALNNRTLSQVALSPNHFNVETKSELLNRFLDSQAEVTLSAREAESSLSVQQTHPDGPETVESILARLPPIDVPTLLAEIESQILEEDDLDIEGLIPPLPKPEPDTGPEVLAELHDGQRESFNGNFNHEGEFHEWFEVVSKKTKDDQLLYVLPYCVIE